MEEEEYNGWSNRETWALSLHINNNEGDYNYWNDRKDELKEEEKIKEPEDMEDLTVKLAQELRDWTEDVFDRVLNNPDEANNLARSMVSDIGSHWRIDYYEVAEGILED